jgi:hypothetical protein
MNGLLMTTRRAEWDSFDVYCGRLKAALSDLKTRLQEGYERRFPGEGSRIRNAIEEAELAAWHTQFPHLFLPDLAEEAVARLVVSVSSTSEAGDGAGTFASVA